MTKNRLRLVIEVDASLRAPWDNDQLHGLADSVGMRNALFFPIRACQALENPAFMANASEATKDSQRAVWGPGCNYFLPGTEEYEGLKEIHDQSNLLSAVIMPDRGEDPFSHEPGLFVVSKITFRRNRTNVGRLGITLRRDGSWCGFSLSRDEGFKDLGRPIYSRS